MSSDCAAMTDSPCETVGSLVRDVRARLAAAGIQTCQQEAVWLIEFALGVSGVRQVIDKDRLLSTSEVAKVHALVRRRAAREPLQYILGTQEFCGIEFDVTPSVLIPRPETELLVEEVIRRISPAQQATVVDICTGSGCIAVAVARLRSHSRVIATDISNASLKVARQNARRHGVENRITWLEGDMLKPLAQKELDGCIDVVVANPPYITEADWIDLQPEVRDFEPRRALVAGPRGTECHERLLKDARRYLSAGGALIMEIGKGQGQAVRRLVESIDGYEPVRLLRDAADSERVMIVERGEE
jgi:release factor glutamine methyltransferase